MPVGIAWLCFSVLFLCASATSASGFKVRHVKTRLADNLYLVDAEIDLAFTQAALEALENGVALTIIIEMEIVRLREFIWNEEIALLEAQRRVRFHPLTNQYLVEDLNAGATRTFRSLGEALKALGRVRDFPLIDSYLLQRGERYTLQLRAYLAIKALPTPLQVLAYLNPVWHLSSEWYESPLDH